MNWDEGSYQLKSYVRPLSSLDTNLSRQEPEKEDQLLLMKASDRGRNVKVNNFLVGWDEFCISMLQSRTARLGSWIQAGRSTLRHWMCCQKQPIACSKASSDTALTYITVANCYQQPWGKIHVWLSWDVTGHFGILYEALSNKYTSKWT